MKSMLGMFKTSWARLFMGTNSKKLQAFTDFVWFLANEVRQTASRNRNKGREELGTVANDESVERDWNKQTPFFLIRRPSKTFVGSLFVSSSRFP